MRDFGAPNPVLQADEDGGLGATVGQRDGFTPSSESIHTGKEETVGKGTGQFDTDVVETYIGVNKCFVVAFLLLVW